MTNLKSTLIFLIALTLLALGLGNLLDKTDTSLYIGTDKTIASIELTKAEYDLVEAELLEMVRTQDPRATMEELRSKSVENTALLNSCHSFGHAIGHAAYEKYGDFSKALIYQSEFCNSAYIHGVVESHFAKSSNVFAELETVCKSYPEGKLLSAQCYHGVGHGLMFYSNNDLPKSLDFCANYKNTFPRHNCLMGVFMENFSSDSGLHESLYVKESDPFYPCQEQTPENKHICYLWAPTYYIGIHKNDYVGALTWCEGAETGYQNVCVQGVGAQIVRENMSKPKLVEAICNSADTLQVPFCIMGMTQLYISHHGSLVSATKLCEQMSATNKKTCYATVKGVESLYN